MSEKNEGQKSNALIRETSPYLLQHAYNPVDWHPWNDETLKRAKETGKPLLVSIGYSACHWCHVMERESFEDEEVAKVMNTYFTCIKVDREERPDVDQLFMNAAQLITGGGGWPLNCIAFPDGRPFFAGTYFKRDNWLDLLQQINEKYQNERQELDDYANRLLEGIRQTSVIEPVAGFRTHQAQMLGVLDQSVSKWSERFDLSYGGSKGAPKFPIPNNYEFLLRYGTNSGNQPVLDYVMLSLTAMARGGIYDQLGGGFARYSVDPYWKVPHFEKMLYDNAQLLSVYAIAYRKFQNPEFIDVVIDTADFVLREMSDPAGGFYSAFDADSEGVEGKYYVWDEQELKLLLGDDFDLCRDWYGINERGYWEENYILVRSDPSEVMLKYELTASELYERIKSIDRLLLEARNKRIKPGLDDKVLTNWSAMMLSGLLEAYKTTGNNKYLQRALEAADFLTETQMEDDGRLWHNYKNGLSTIPGFLDDYVTLISACLDLFEITMDMKWMDIADRLCQRTMNSFYSEEMGFFAFTSHQSNDLVAQHTDYFDSVTPSSNSVMCRNLIRIDRLMHNKMYRNIALEMLTRIAPRVVSYGSGFSNWMSALLDEFGNFFEVVVVGENASEFIRDLEAQYLPNCLISGSAEGKGLPVFEHRYVPGKTLIYVCQDNTCQAPVDRVDAALDIIKK